MINLFSACTLLCAPPLEPAPPHDVAAAGLSAVFEGAEPMDDALIRPTSYERAEPEGDYFAARPFVQERVRRTPRAFTLRSGETVLETGVYGFGASGDLTISNGRRSRDIGVDETVAEGQVLLRRGFSETVEVRLFGNFGAHEVMFDVGGDFDQLHKAQGSAGVGVKVAAPWEFASGKSAILADIGGGNNEIWDEPNNFVYRVAGVTEWAIGPRATLGGSVGVGNYSLLDPVDTTVFASAIMELMWTDRLATFGEGFVSGGEGTAGVGLIWQATDVFSLDAGVGFTARLIEGVREENITASDVDMAGAYVSLGCAFRF